LWWEKERVIEVGEEAGCFGSPVWKTTNRSRHQRTPTSIFQIIAWDEQKFILLNHASNLLVLFCWLQSML